MLQSLHLFTDLGMRSKLAFASESIGLSFVISMGHDFNVQESNSLMSFTV